MGGAVFLLAAVGFASGRRLLRPTREVGQPISFNHRLHAEQTSCDTCHEGVRRAAHSGLPGLTICLTCHEEPLTQSPEEAKIKQLAAAGEDQVFRKLFRLPDNVYFTHRRHVGVAGLECSLCHCDIAKSETPPDAPRVRVSMDFCIRCHQLGGLSTDCTRCHR